MSDYEVLTIVELAALRVRDKLRKHNLTEPHEVAILEAISCFASEIRKLKAAHIDSLKDQKQ